MEETTDDGNIRSFAGSSARSLSFKDWNPFSEDSAESKEQLAFDQYLFLRFSLQNLLLYGMLVYFAIKWHKKIEKL